VKYLLDFLVHAGVEIPGDLSPDSLTELTEPPGHLRISGDTSSQALTELTEPAPGIVIDRPDPEARRLAMEALADDPEALAEREAIRWAERPHPADEWLIGYLTAGPRLARGRCSRPPTTRSPTKICGRAPSGSAWS
jgi:hypothetical protein